MCREPIPERAARSNAVASPKKDSQCNQNQESYDCLNMYQGSDFLLKVLQ